MSEKNVKSEFTRVQQEALKTGILSVDAGNGYLTEDLDSVLDTAVKANEASRALLKEGFESGAIPAEPAW